VSWDGALSGLPLVHFRALKHEVSFPAYWQALKGGTDLHLDIRAWLMPPAGDLPGLDETARKLGCPGLLNRSESDVLDAWLQGRHEQVQAYSDIAALNTYLLALRLFLVTGEISHHDKARGQDSLRDLLAGLGEPHLAEFLAAWGGA
jgi:predicted PolB exonuclease-like 3'-5' exonuclease